MRQVVYIALILMLSLPAGAQVLLERQLVGSGSHEYASGGLNVSASVGEVSVRTALATGYIVSQGFQQSNYVLSNPYIIELTSTPAACIGANDGTAGVIFYSSNMTPPYSYAWSNGGTNDTISGLTYGVYDVTVTDANNNQVVQVVAVAAVDSIECAPGFYTGITPNNDNLNDYWHVDNYAFFEKREVQIFNRYGALVWESDLYDNFEDRFTGTHRNGNELPDGTYFFIARFDDSTYRGWIEISR